MAMNVTTANTIEVGEYVAATSTGDAEPRPRLRAVYTISAAAAGLAVLSMPIVPLPVMADRSPRVVPSSNQRPRVPGNKRNEPCDCGCGMKRKRCPKFGR